jgi:hypothetical protein
MSLKEFIAKLEAEVEALAHLSFLKAAAKQAIHNGLEAAFKAGNSGTVEAVVVADVNGFITTTTSSLGPIVSGVAGLGEVGIDDAINAAFAHFGSTASEAEFEAYVFTHLGLN